MRSSVLSLFCVSIVLSQASPLYTNRQVCDGEVVTVLVENGPKAEQFCGRYLGLPQVTVTVSTVTVTKAVYATPTSLSEEQMEMGERFEGRTYLGHGEQLLDDASDDTPEYLYKYSISPRELSSACSCLTIPTPTISVTAVTTITTLITQTPVVRTKLKSMLRLV